MTSLLECARRIDGYDPESLGVDTARKAMLACIEPIRECERMPTALALGRILATPVVPAIDVPPHDNSAMDGYALRAADLPQGRPGALRLIGSALAGQPFRGLVAAGQCVRIMTGAPIPSGADTVVAQELVSLEGDTVLVPAGRRPGENLRRAGEDLRRGVAVLEPGRRLGPAEIGLIASLGIAGIEVGRRLRVAHFSSGDEIASLGSPLAPGQVYDSNRYTIGALLDRMGAERLDLGVARDEPRALASTLRHAAGEADAIITTGGVSEGEADHLRPVLARLGEMLHWKLALRPGRPFAFGRIGKALLFGLPGNPVAAMVAFTQLVREPLLRMGGRRGDCALPQFPAVAAEALRKRPGRSEYQRGILFVDAQGRCAVRSSGNQGSGVLRSMSEANCFIVLEQARGNVAAGESVTVQPFEWLN